MTMSAAMIKEYKMTKHKKTDPLFLFLEGQMHLSHSVYFDFFSCYRFDETIFKLKLNTHFTKYTDILIFNFGHIIYTQRCIMPL